jgi:DNA-binding response OmpR family regulator
MEKKYIVVCDDEEDIRDTVVDAVERLGFEAIELTNGKQAYNFVLNDTRVSQVLFMVLDIKMPLKNGVETVTDIRGSYCNYSDLPIVMLSAYEDTVLWNRLSGLICGYIRKPFDFRQLEHFAQEIAKGAERVQDLRDNSVNYASERHKDFIFAKAYRGGMMGKMSEEDVYEKTGGIEGKRPEDFDPVDKLKENGF